MEIAGFLIDELGHFLPVDDCIRLEGRGQIQMTTLNVFDQTGGRVQNGGKPELFGQS